MVVMGVDPSSRTWAMVVLDGDQPYVFKTSVPQKIKDPQQIARDLYAAGLLYLTSWSPLAVYIEEPLVAGARNLQSSLKIARSVGVFMGACVAAGITHTYLIPVATWKAKVVGHGNASKDDVRAWLAGHKPEIAEICGDDQDLRDAACIALYGQGLQRRVDAIRSGFQSQPLDA